MCGDGWASVTSEKDLTRETHTQIPILTCETRGGPPYLFAADAARSAGDMKKNTCEHGRGGFLSPDRRRQAMERYIPYDWEYQLAICVSCETYPQVTAR